MEGQQPDILQHSRARVLPDALPQKKKKQTMIFFFGLMRQWSLTPKSYTVDCIAAGG